MKGERRNRFIYPLPNGFICKRLTGASQRPSNLILDNDMKKINLYPATLLNIAFVEDLSDALVRSELEPKDPSKLGYF